MEGVSPEAVFLLGKDLNSFSEIAQGLLDGNPRAAPAGHHGPADARAPDRAAQAVRGDAHARPAPSSATCRAWSPRAKRRPRSSPTASRCARASRRCRSELGSETGFGGLTLVAAAAVRAMLAASAAAGFLRLYVRDQAPARRARRSAAPRGRAPGAGSQARQRRQPGGDSAPDERTADGGRRRPDAAGDGDRGHHRRHRRLGELHGGGAAHAGVAGAGHGRPRDRRRREQVEANVDRAAGRVDRAAARDPRHRRVGAADGRPNQRRVGAGAGNGPGGAPVAAGRRVRPAGGAEHDRRHELDPRPDPGNLQADQAAGRVVAGDRRDHRADLGHYRADQRAGAERRHPGGVGRRSRPRLLGGCRGSAAAGRALRPTRRARSRRW